MAEVGAHFTIKEVDAGFNDLIKNIYTGEKPKILVGILAKDGGKPHQEGSELTIADIAAIHEYGLGDAIERSFLRAWFDAYQPQCREAIRRMMRQVVDGKLDKYKALEQLGAWMSGQIQLFIAANKVEPPTSEETNQRKKSSVTLIDKGILRSSISFAVEGVKKQPKVAPLKVTGFNSKKSKAARKRLGRKALRASKRAKRFANQQNKKIKRLKNKSLRFGKRTVKRVVKSATKQKKGRKRK